MRNVYVYVALSGLRHALEYIRHAHAITLRRQRLYAEVMPRCCHIRQFVMRRLRYRRSHCRRLVTIRVDAARR